MHSNSTLIAQFSNLKPLRTQNRFKQRENKFDSQPQCATIKNVLKELVSILQTKAFKNYTTLPSFVIQA